MATDFYAVLGVSKDADTAQIKKAYRKLAASRHPDKHPGDKSAEARFKQVNQAYQVLGDPKKRALYDEFGEQALSEGFDPERARAYRQWAPRGRGRNRVEATRDGTYDAEELFGSEGGLGDMLGDLFGRARRAGSRGTSTARMPDTESELTIDFPTAIKGATMSLQLAGSAEPIQVRIPPGATEGSKLRIKGQGSPNPFGGPPADLILLIRVTPHPHFRLEDGELHMNVPITVGEAYRGSRIRVPTPRGEVALKVPAGAQSGHVVRLRGKGLDKKDRAAGDLYVHFQVQIPTSEAPDLRAAIDTVDRYCDPDVRRSLRL